MKAVRSSSLASIDDYAIETVDAPEPSAGEVVVRVAACGIGYVDALIASGRYQVRPPLPHVPGQEVGGRVHAVGAGVEGLAPGDRVLAVVAGGFAEFAKAAAGDVCRIPDRMTLAQAAGFRVNYLTALHGLQDRARLAPGERLLVFGAAGGVGLATVQVGRALGATVLAAASTPERREHALAHGAHAAIDTDPDGWRDRLKAALGGAGPDVVFDPVCGPLFEPAFRSLAWGGRHCVVGFVGGPIPALKANLPLLKGASLVGVDVRQFQLLEPQRALAHLQALLRGVDEGALDPPVGREFAFEDHRAALAFAFEGRGVGKTVLRVADLD
ncbi:MAG TPA: NADPH:quinone oxidoreductase family protein [Burkholderiaceae bacterium]|nr:NADPH:quinone oxidoreductase family protein [Burkholderiaceae bacterium]